MKNSLWLLIFIFLACSSQKKDNLSIQNKQKMTFIHFNSFEDAWKKVDSLEKKGLTKTAMAFVKNAIYSKAKKENNAPQIVKSLLYLGKYLNKIDENPQDKVLALFKKEIAENNPPAKNILENYLAQMYWQYLQSNFYKSITNTQAGATDNNDFRTWDNQKMLSVINKHFDHSLQNEYILLQIPLKSFSDILTPKKFNDKYMPSIYDLLLNETLKFYLERNNFTTAPAYKFEINKPEYLSDLDRFIQLKIQSKDSLSFELKALQLFQKILKLRKNTDVDALAWWDFKRLYFVHEKAVFDQKDEIYLQQLKKFVEKYKNSDVSALALFEIANLYNKSGQKYNPKTNPDTQFDLIKALDYCNLAIEKYPKSTGANQCKNLKSSILNKNITIELPKYFNENKEQLIKIKYKNVSHIDLNIYKINQIEYDKFVRDNHTNKEIYQFIKTYPTVKNWQVNLKDLKDYQSHTTERVLPAISNGQYILLAEAKHNNDEVFGYTHFQAADIALQILNKKKRKEFAVISRENGKPVTDCKIKIEKTNRNNKFNFFKEISTGNKNSFEIKKPSNYNKAYRITVDYANGKTAYFYENFYAYYNSNYRDKVHNKAFIFTDRSIYRPGQPLYFKIIALAQKPNQSELIKDEIIEVDLKDVNYQIIKRIQVKTNEYGSAQGSFIIPENVLTGNFSLELRSANHSEHKLYTTYYFKVENYKRPKFDVKFKPVEGSFKVNQRVEVTGLAQSYAGANITDAKVTYRVKRKVQMPRWWYWYRPYFSSSPREIAHGTTQTNEKGEFKIDFIALPDRKVKKEDKPVFNYEITAEVTDINGETHMATTVVNVGYHSLLAALEMDTEIDKNKTADTLKIKITNLNGVEVPAQGTIEIYKLKAPDRILRSRPWEAPDVQEISKAEFIKLFPHIPYDDKEADYKYWKKGKKYFDTSFDTAKQKEVLLKNKSRLPEGKYLALLTTTDKEGNTITDKHFFDVISTTEKTVADNKYFFSLLDKNSYSPGDKLNLTLASAIKGAYVRVLVEKHEKIISDKYVKLDGTKNTQIVSVDKNDEGGFVIHYIFNAYNDYEHQNIVVNVPYPSKELQIETLHFRDKLLPGQKETWSFKIKGPKGEKVSSELLASMYDASLDAFSSHAWNFNPINWKYYYPKFSLDSGDSYQSGNINLYFKQQVYYQSVTIIQPELDWFGFNFINRIFGNRNVKFYALGTAKRKKRKAPVQAVMAEEMDASFDTSNNIVKAAEINKIENPQAEKETVEIPVQIRKNLKETAFFYPQLHTDKEGNVSFTFTAPEALTKWKLQLLAHDKDLNYGYKKLFAQTQKDLMVFPNAPRFVREGDELVFASKITNKTDKKLSGTAHIVLTDAINGKDITQHLLHGNDKIDFNLSANGNTVVKWKLNIPDDVQAITYKIIAKAGNQSDGEQNAMPVLTNRMLVTETMPMWVRAHQSKTFVLDKLKNNRSKTLKNHTLTLEITSNPAWYAVQALPYIMEYPYECSEQTFSRYYANTLGGHIIEQHPKIKDVFKQWKNSKALLSALEKNQELKSIIIEATPWLRDAQNETEQKKRIGLLFDLNKMAYEQEKALKKLSDLQLSNGGFVWFKGGKYPSRFITQHILAGFGHLKHLGVNIDKSERMTKRAIKYLDDELNKDYQKLLENAEKSKDKEKYLKEYRTGYTVLHYLYARSFYPEIEPSQNMQKIYDYYLKQAQKYWLKYPYYSQGLLALTSFRNGNEQLAKDIIRSLDENSVQSPELGMYWKDAQTGWFWYQAPIERQALLIEAFDEITHNTNKINEMRIWLLKNKQTNAWKTTKQTTEAVYALLSTGTDCLSLQNNVEVEIGNTKINPSKDTEIRTEAGTGYFKKVWHTKEIKPKMSEVKISNKGNGIAWGALYWQYFENMDKITSATNTPLTITKKLFLRKYTDTGEELQPITEQSPIKVGDLVRVRIIIKVDREMEYIHLKDMRAGGFEPVNVLSRYKWQNGLGYYEATTDVATNFFIGKLYKGTYVFEYDLRANNAGKFSNGITSIQSMYAPEFSSHSEGIRVEIE